MAKKRSKKTKSPHAGKSAMQIVQEAMPDMEVIPAKDLARSGESDRIRATVSPGASLQRLKADQGGSVAGAADQTPPQPSTVDNNQIEVFQVRPKERSADTGSGPGPKTVIVNKQLGIVGVEG